MESPDWITLLQSPLGGAPRVGRGPNFLRVRADFEGGSGPCSWSGRRSCERARRRSSLQDGRATLWLASKLPFLSLASPPLALHRQRADLVIRVPTVPTVPRFLPT
jgi:hypothetical protein